MSARRTPFAFWGAFILLLGFAALLGASPGEDPASATVATDAPADSSDELVRELDAFRHDLEIPAVPVDYFDDGVRPDLVVLSSTDVHGEIEPCGCNKSPKGGLSRRAAFVDSMRAMYGNVLVVDAGEFSVSPSSLAEAKSLFVLEAMKEMGYDAINPGTTDLQLGLDVLLPVVKDCPVPFVSANLKDKATGALLFRDSVILTKGKMRVGVTGITVPSDVERALVDSLGVFVEDAATSLEKIVPALRAKTDLVVLLAHLPDADARRLGEKFFKQIDVVVVGVATASRGVVTPEHGGALYLTSGNRGQALGFAKIAMGDGRPKALVGDEVVLATSIPVDPKMAKTTEDFRRHLNELAKIEVVQEFAGGRRTPDGHYYLGAENCASCHPRETEIWRETSHAHAFATLQENAAESLPECYVCHVTGAKDAAGYDPRYDQASALVNVQCEMCHDMGSRHARDGSYGKARLMNACLQCHDPENSPEYEPDVYWKMIEH